MRTLFFLSLLFLPAIAFSQTQFEIIETTISEIHTAYASGSLTARELVQAYLDRIEAYDQQGPEINAILSMNDRALEEADKIDEVFRLSGFVGPLHGIPVVLKDQMDVMGLSLIHI